MRGIALGLAIGIWATAACAADQPGFAPPADWVTPAEIPAPTPEKSQAAVEVLLEDLQDKFDSEGKDSYFESAARIQTPQGLEAIGTIALNWNPETETLIIHKLRIIRGAQSIDVLAGGQKFTVLRRENNLERAMLDGTLTAAIEPEGLQVGDILDFAFTRQERDPITRGRSERVTSIPQFPTRRFRVRELWPDSIPTRWRKSDELATPKLSAHGSQNELVIDMADTEPPKIPKFAPERFSDAGRFEFSLSPTWNDVSALMTPLYRKAATLTPNSTLRTEIETIRAQSGDPKIRAAAALRLVQDKIRYVFLGTDNGGFTPADADVTWSRRFGDCKGKTVVLLALLQELGIDATPALVNTSRGDGLDQRLPVVGAFDHVLVRTMIAGKVYWLDGTRTGDRALDDIKTPPFKWALPIQPGGASLEALLVPPLERPESETDLHLDASGGIDVPAPAHAVLVLRGDEAVNRRLKLADMTAAEAERYLRNYWHEEYDFIDVNKVDSVFDEAAGEERLTMDGSAKMDWKSLSGGWRRYETDGSHLGWKADFDRDPGPYQDAPYAVPFPYFDRWTETIGLPNGGAGFTLQGADVDKTAAGRVFKRVSTLDKGVFKMEASVRSTAPEFPAIEAPAAKATLKEMNEVTVYLFVPLQAPAVAGLSGNNNDKPPKTAEEFASRGAALLATGDFSAAIAAFSRVIALKPDFALAYATRGLALLQKPDLAGAKSDIEKALRIEPKNAFGIYAQGVLYLAQHQLEQALESFNQAITLSPEFAGNYSSRGSVYLMMKQPAKALADLNEALRLQPNEPYALNARAGTFIFLGNGAKALADADTLVSLLPKQAGSHVARGNALLALRRNADARQAFETANALKPTPEAYIGLAQARGAGEQTQKLADVGQALRLKPHWTAAYGMEAQIYFSKGDYPDGLKSLSEAIRLEPQNLDLIGRRAAAYAEARQFDNAVADLNRLLAAKPNSLELLGQRCRVRALANKQLDAALSDCQAVVKASGDDDEAIEALAFVYLHMQRYDDAIADYDAVLARRPNSAIAHFGRGTAELGKHDDARGKPDIATALTSNPNIEADFNGTSTAFAQPADTTNTPSAVADADPLHRAELHLQQKEFAAAVADLDQAIREKPTARAFAERSIANYWLGAFDKARDDADKAASLDPTDFVAFHGHGLLDSRAGDYQRAVADFSGAIGASPQDAFAFFWRGISYQSLQDFDKALADFTEALRLSPANDDVYIRRAEIFIAEHDGQKALAEADHYLAAHDTNAFAHGLRGAGFRLLDKQDEAANEIRRFVQLKPSLEAYLEWTKLHNPEDPGQALADIDLALKIDPKSATAHRARAFLLAKGNDYVGAAAALNEALRVAPDDDTVLAQLAEVHARNGQYDLAIAESDQVLNRHPDNATYLNNGCWFRAIAGKQLDAALDLCNAALKAKPNMAAILDSRGLVKLRLSRLDEAIQDYDAALKLQPRLLSSLFGRGIAKQRKGAAEDAKSDLAAARAIDSKIDAQFAVYDLAP